MGYIDVCSGVFQVGGGHLSHPDDCCVYLLSNEVGTVLVDAGSQTQSQRILNNIKQTDINTASVKTIIVTHGHIDHIGGLSWLKQHFDANIVAHEREMPAVAEGQPNLTAAAYYGIEYVPVTVEQVITTDAFDIVLGNNTLTCLLTPGHTPGSMSLYTDIEGNRVLFGQDIHGPFSASWGSDLLAWRNSMQILIELNADILCEGHFGIIEGQQKIKDFIAGYLRQYRKN